MLVNLAMPLDNRAASDDKAQYPISRESTARLVKYVIANGMDGIVFGDRVELGRMSYRERARYYMQTVDTVGGAVPTYAVACASSTQGALRLVRVAARAGATGVVASFPALLPNQRNLAGYFRDVIEVARSLNLEVYLADEPRGESISPEVMEDVGYSGIRGIMWGRYDTLDLDTIRIRKPDACRILARNDYIGRELAHDVDGTISDIANIDPLGIGYFFRELHAAKQLTPELGGIWARYLPLLRLMRTDRVMVRACIENALAHTFPEGFPVFSMAPRGKLDVAQENQLRLALEQMKPKDIHPVRR